MQKVCGPEFLAFRRPRRVGPGSAARPQRAARRGQSRRAHGPAEMVMSPRRRRSWRSGSRPAPCHRAGGVRRRSRFQLAHCDGTGSARDVVQGSALAARDRGRSVMACAMSPCRVMVGMRTISVPADPADLCCAHGRAPGAARAAARCPPGPRPPGRAAVRCRAPDRSAATSSLWRARPRACPTCEDVSRGIIFAVHSWTGPDASCASW